MLGSLSECCCSDFMRGIILSMQFYIFFPNHNSELYPEVEVTPFKTILLLVYCAFYILVF